MLTYSQLNQECERWRNRYLSSDAGSIVEVSKEQIRLIYLSLAAAKARHYNDKVDPEFVELDKSL